MVLRAAWGLQHLLGNQQPVLAARLWVTGAEEGVAVYKGHGDFIAALNLIPARNKTNVATRSAGFYRKGQKWGQFPVLLTDQIFYSMF